jgi:phosphohistidine phosphatase
MDLIVWRHAQAENSTESGGDMRRALTARGHEQAERMAAWLDRRLPADTRILCSSALRCQQTALALKRKYQLCRDLGPDVAIPDALLTSIGWPKDKSTVLLVGHQPTLGQIIAQLTGMYRTTYPLCKGALWWLRARQRDGQTQTLIVAVQSFEMLC